MTEQFTPDTATIKQAIQHNLPPAMAAEALRIFNRWYSAELAEAREEGRQRGIQEAEKAGYVLFQGPYEYYSDFETAHRIMEGQAEFHGEYYTLLSVHPSEVNEREDALGLTVRPPMIHAAQAGNNQD